MVMVEVMMKDIDMMMMHDLWAKMEELMWKDEMMKAHFEHSEYMDQ